MCLILSSFYGIAGQARNDGRHQAEQKVIEEYEVFNKTQKIVSDFDKQIKKMIENN